jgi:hypothetical protein
MSGSRGALTRGKTQWPRRASQLVRLAELTEDEPAFSVRVAAFTGIAGNRWDLLGQTE